VVALALFLISLKNSYVPHKSAIYPLHVNLNRAYTRMLIYVLIFYRNSVL
jgi:hypothetical protein